MKKLLGIVVLGLLWCNISLADNRIILKCKRNTIDWVAIIDLENMDLNRFGVSIGSGIGGIGTIEDNKTILSDRGPKKISPLFVPGAISNMV